MFRRWICLILALFTICTGVSCAAAEELLRGVSWTEPGYFWHTNGTRVSTEYTQRYQSTLEKIALEPNTAYTLSNFCGVYTLYNSDGSSGVASNPHYNPNIPVDFETGEDPCCIGISHVITGDYTAERVSLRTVETKSNAAIVAVAEPTDPPEMMPWKPLSGKTVVCFGDSLFGMHRGEDSTPAYIAENTGATVYNVGFGGCRMSVHPYAGYEAFSMWALAGAIAENDWSWQETQAGEGSEYFADQLLLLESIDFNEVDAAVIHYGTNDFAAGNGIAVDNPENPLDYETLCGALRYSVEKLLGAYPKLKIYVSLPVYRYWTEEDGTIIYAEEYKNKSGHTLIEFCEALRGVAEEYNLPVIDGYRELGVNRINASAFLSDGTHFNAEGRQRFGEYIAARLMAQ